MIGDQPDQMREPRCGDFASSRALDGNAREGLALVRDRDVVGDDVLGEPVERRARQRCVDLEPDRVGPRDRVQIGDDATFAGVSSSA